MFRSKDNIIYDHLKDVVPAGVAGSVVHGTAAMRQDVFGFYYASNLVAGDEIVFMYRQRQVLADKAIGTGEAIISGDRLFYIVANDNVSPTPVGVAGVNSYFCGWAIENALANDTDVLMNFDGTRPDQLF